jgi:hypothetical protein
MTSLKQAISLQQQIIKSSRNQQIIYGSVSARCIYPHIGARYVKSGKSIQSHPTLTAWFFSRGQERKNNSSSQEILRSATLVAKIRDTKMAEKTTTVENAMPHRPYQENATTADLDHSIAPYHTLVSTTPKLTQIGTRTVTEMNGQTSRAICQNKV